jgi:hypothetical protein
MDGTKLSRSPADPEKALSHLLEECRMVLPGIQALFGFQLIAIFNAPFKQLLSGGEQVAHLVALGFVGMAVGLAMAPAAFHRISEPDEVTPSFLRLASVLLGVGMGCLLIGIGTDAYLIARVVCSSVVWAGFFCGVLSAVLLSLWYVFPLLRARTRQKRRTELMTRN